MMVSNSRLAFVLLLLLVFLLINVEGWADNSDRSVSGPRTIPHGMVSIPAGLFEMGTTDKHGSADEYPQHTVSLDAFYLDRYEVTNRQFRKFVKASGYKTTAEAQGKAWAYVEDTQWTEVLGAWWRKPEGQESVFATRRGSHPVVTLSWDDARTYCEGVGKRLPTEAEWEYAARAGSATNAWWGNRDSGAREVGNVADQTHKREFPDRPWPVLERYDDHYVRTAPVGTFEPNVWGLYDMIGNASEWVADWYAGDYYSKSQRKNPKGPSTGYFKVLRGGSWSTSPTYLGTGVRIYNAPTTSNAAHGVRCAKNAGKQ